MGFKFYHSSEEVFQNLERTVIQKPALGRKHLKERNDYIIRVKKQKVVALVDFFFL